MGMSQRKLEAMIVKAKLSNTRKMVSYLVDLEIKTKGKISNMLEKAARIRKK